MDQLQEVATFLRKQLAEVEAKITSMKPVHSNLMTITEIREKIANMYENKEWKKYIETGIVENIIDHLDKFYEVLLRQINEANPLVHGTLVIGSQNTRMWQEFQLKVIKRVANPSNMDTYLNFTADFCDGFVWNAAWVEIHNLLT